jgi:hypothetical protein
MKALLRLLVVCLVTLALVSPALVVWKVWQNHSELVNAQRVVSPEQRLIPKQVVSTTNFGEFSHSNFQLRRLQICCVPPGADHITENPITASALLGLIVSVPIGFYSGLLLNHRYRSRRHTTLRQQVATLEKIWQQSIF